MSSERQAGVEGRPGPKFWLGLLVLTAFFSPWLMAWGWFAWNDDLASYTLLIPFISAYLIWQGPGRGQSGDATVWAAGIDRKVLLTSVLAAGVFGGLAFSLAGRGGAETRHDYLAPAMLSYVAALVAMSSWSCGGAWVRRHSFPFGFMVFAAPLPTWAVHGLEVFFQHTSAEVAAWMIQLTGIPNLRSGLFFQLPGITVQVAEECSGIRSSLVLFIVSTLAGHLLLRSPRRRLFLSVFVIPLGIVRNGFRILTIAALCTYVSPRMIDSYIHHRGGPIFFALSLIPLFLVLLWLRRGERRGERQDPRQRPDQRGGNDRPGASAGIPSGGPPSGAVGSGPGSAQA